MVDELIGERAMPRLAGRVPGVARLLAHPATGGEGDYGLSIRSVQHWHSCCTDRMEVVGVVVAQVHPNALKKLTARISAVGVTNDHANVLEQTLVVKIDDIVVVVVIDCLLGSSET